MKVRIMTEITKSFAYSGKAAPNEKIIGEMANEVQVACPGLTPEMVNPVFVEARKLYSIPSISEISKAWATCRIPEIIRKRIDHSPFMLRGCVKKAHECNMLIFSDPIMYRLCLAYNVVNTICPPTEYALNNDIEIRKAYQTLWEQYGEERQINHLPALGNLSGSKYEVPTAEIVLAKSKGLLK